MLILNGGIPRSGTVWVMNVLGDILTHHGRAYEITNANSPEEVDQALARASYAANTIIHFHNVTPLLLEVAAKNRAVSFYNFRDPRDVVVSQMRLHDAEFERALQMTIAATRNFIHALNLHNVTLLPYHHLIEAPSTVVHFIANRLGIFVPQKVLQAVVEKNALEKNRKVMNDVAEGQIATASAHTGKRAIAYDPKRLITDRHIQSGKTGRWKEELSDEQQKVVNEAFADFNAKFF